MFIAGILTLLSPVAADIGGLGWLIAARVFIGFCHGVIFPALHGAWSHWAPPGESSKLVSIHIAGASFGTVIVFPLGGILADTLGWRYIFYVTGALTLAWCILWAFLVYDTPQQHPRISEQELVHITSSIEESRKREAAAESDGPTKRTPWKSILTSAPVWALTVSHIASNWGTYQLNTMMPTYLSSVLRQVIHFVKKVNLKIRFSSVGMTSRPMVSCHLCHSS